MASLEDITRELECSICGSVMIDPRVLHCQHSFCLRCIFVLIKRDRSQNPFIKCPFGCPAVCSTERGDVRSLKRNPLIASLCASRRRSTFSPNDAACDWCSSDHVACKMCSKCSSVICHRCDDEPMSDHAFLCSDHTSRVSPIVAPGHELASTAENEELPVKRYEPLVSSKSATASIRDFFQNDKQLRRYAGNCRSTIDHEPELVVEDCDELIYIPHFVQQCVAKAVMTDGGEQVSQYSVVVPAPNFQGTPETFAHLTKKQDSERLWDSDELLILSRCISGSENLATVVDDCARIASQIRRALAFPSTSCTDLNIVVSMAVFLREIYDLVSYVVIPLLRRSALFANFWGHKHVERLCQLYHQAPTPVRKAEVTKRIKAHLEIGGGLGKQFHIAAEAAQQKLELLVVAVDGLESALLKSLDAASTTANVSDGEARPRVSTLLKVPEHLEAMRISFANIVDMLRKNIAELHKEMPEAVRGIGLDDNARAAIIALEKKFAEECDKFLGICGSSQHIHVLWTQCVIVLGKKFERKHLHQFLQGRRGRFSLQEPFTLSKLNESIEQASRMMANVIPQIGSVRDQHISLLRRNISDMNGLLILQNQLCNLTTQVLDVFQKEHFIKLREVSTSSTEYLMELSNFVTRSYLDERPEEHEILGSCHDIAEISKVLTSLGSRLNEKCRFVHRSAAMLLELTRCMGRCAAVLLHANTFDLITPRITTSPVLPPRSIEEDNEALFGEVDFDGASTSFVLEEVRRRVAKDVPNMIRGAAAIQLEGRSRILLPYRRGHFFLPQRFPFRSFEYLVDAQTGDFIVEEIPEHGFDRVLTLIENFVNSKATFILVNSVVAAAAIVYKKVH
jgi:hypothetical protein